MARTVTGDTKTPNSEVIVNSISDFPAAVGGVITLEDGKAYVLGASLTTSNRFVLGANNTITTASPRATLFTYTGTGVMFTGTDVSVIMDGLVLNCPTASFAVTMTSSDGTHTFDSTRFIVATTVGVASFTSMRSINFSLFGCNEATTGIVFNGATIDSMSMERFRINSTSSSFVGIDFGTTVFENAEMSNLILTGPAGGIGIDGATNSANVTSGSIVTVRDGLFSGGLDPLNNISESDIRWEFTNNGGIRDSMKAADTSLIITETVTINTQGVYEDIGGTNWTTAIADRFTTTNAGVMTYISETDVDAIIIGTATIEKVGGGTDQLGMKISVNGTVLDRSISVTENANPTSVTCIALINITENDTIKLEVANIEGTSNITVSNAALVVQGTN